MRDFVRGLYYYVLNRIILNIPFWNVRRTFLIWTGHKIDKSCSINIGCFVFGRGQKLQVGSRTTINSGCVLDARSSLEIGDGCSISRNVTFISRSHNYKSKYFELTDSPISVGNNVWVGTNATILPGVIIGDNCIIGAGAVVTKDCETNGIYIGNPARLHKKNSVEINIPQAFIPWFGLQN